MPGLTPLTAAAPLLGGRPGAHAAPGPSPFRTAATVVCMLAAFGSAAIGILLHGACMPAYELPAASARMCASPVANALTGTTFPAGPGRAPGTAAAFDPVTSWFVDIGFALGGHLAPADMMAFLLVINTLAVAVMALGLVHLMRDRAWLPVACISPAIVFSIGQSLDPVGVALLVWGLVLLNPRVGGGHSNAAAGALLALAALINPLGIIAVLVIGALLWQAGQRSDLLMIAGVGLIVLGIALAADGRVFARLAAWWQQPIDRGSLASLFVYGDVLSPQLLAGISLSITVLATAAALVIMCRMPRPNLYAALTVVLGIAVVTLPAAPVTHALWLLPLAALAVRRLWVFLAWAAAEASFAIAVNLTDITAFDATRGLAPGWMLIFTCLRIAAVLTVVITAAFELRRDPAEPASSRTTATTAPGAGTAHPATASGAGEGKPATALGAAAAGAGAPKALE